ncbi:MAG: radical SAM protein [Candidatus Lokiarchaeota archaeon]|nr:radical SAM protein [Candidatus Lokiarchaeota archaeon]
MKEDPQFSPFGPEMADIEVSTSCSRGCPWCYKSNLPAGKNMSIDTFKALFRKLPDTLTQIAFGIGDLDANPDLWNIFRYCRENQVIPNVTINGSHLTTEHAKKLVELCGSVAVSHYEDDTCFDAVALLAKSGGKQINIHQLMSLETTTDCLELVKKTCVDRRLVHRLNAVIFLSLKKKGRGKTLHPMDAANFKELIVDALRRKINFGFDSCSANRFLGVIQDLPNKQHLSMMVEPCEGSCFSCYINVDGIAYPCSFLEGQPSIKGISVPRARDFIHDVWFSREFSEFRKKLIHNKRSCPEFNEGSNDQKSSGKII